MTKMHVAHFAALKMVAAIGKTLDVLMPDFDTGRMERSSRIDTVVSRVRRSAIEMPRMDAICQVRDIQNVNVSN